MGDDRIGGFIEGIAGFQDASGISLDLEVDGAGDDVAYHGAGVFVEGAFLSGGEVDLADVDFGDGAGVEMSKHELFAHNGGLGGRGLRGWCLCDGKDTVEHQENGECGDEVKASHVFEVFDKGRQLPVRTVQPGMKCGCRL